MLKVNKLFNAELKQEYLQYANTQYLQEYAIDNIDYVFRLSSMYEFKFNKDLCQFSKDELAEIFVHFLWLEMHLFNRRKKIIEKYVEWVLQYHSEIENVNITDIQSIEYKQIDYSILVRDTYYSGLDNLFRTVDNIIPTDDEYKLMYKCFFGLIWEGFDETEIPFIKKDGLIKKNGNSVVVIESQEYVIDDLLWDMCQKLAKVDELETVFMSESSRNTTPPRAKLYVCNSEYLFAILVNHKEGIYNSSDPVNFDIYLKNRVRYWRKCLEYSTPENNLYANKSYNRRIIIQSGMLYRMHEYEKETGNYVFTVADDRQRYLAAFKNIYRKSLSSTAKDNIVKHIYPAWVNAFYKY